MRLAIVWFCAFDLGRPVDPVEGGRKLLQSGIAEAMLSYDDKGDSFVEPRGIEQETGMLHLMAREDIVLFQDEYRMNHRFARLKLRGFDATILDVRSKMEVYLTIHRAGFAALSFWFSVDKDIKLSDIIIMEDPFSKIKVGKIWEGFLDHIKRFKMVPAEFIGKIERGEEFDTSISRLHNLYRSFMMSVMQEMDSKRERKIRYPFTGIFSAVVIFDVNQLEKFLEDHKKELHGILAEERMWDWVSESWIEKAMEKNLAWREGWAVYIGNARALMVVSKEANDKLRSELKRRFVEGTPDIIAGIGPAGLLPGLHPPYIIVLDKEKVAEGILERIWEDQLKGIMLDLTTIIENLSLQKIMLESCDYALGEGMPESIKDLSDIRKQVHEVMEEFLNVRVWRPLTATEWVEYGKKVMRINEMYEAIRNRLDLLEGRIRALYDRAFNILILILTIISGYLQMAEVMFLLGFSGPTALLIPLLIPVVLLPLAKYFWKII